MIISVRSIRSAKTRKNKIYLLWWRSNFPNWKSVIKYKMPNRINKKNKIRGKSGLPRFFWVMLTDSKGGSIPIDEIKKITIFETDSKLELLEFLSEKNFPLEIINIFMSKL